MKEALRWWMRLHAIVHLEVVRALEPETAERLWIESMLELREACWQEERRRAA